MGQRRNNLYSYVAFTSTSFNNGYLNVSILDPFEEIKKHFCTLYRNCQNKGSGWQVKIVKASEAILKRNFLNKIGNQRIQKRFCSLYRNSQRKDVELNKKIVKGPVAILKRNPFYKIVDNQRVRKHFCSLYRDCQSHDIELKVKTMKSSIATSRRNLFFFIKSSTVNVLENYFVSSVEIVKMKMSDRK